VLSLVAVGVSSLLMQQGHPSVKAEGTLADVQSALHLVIKRLLL